MTTKQPLVSVCMITYNHGAFIKKAIDGVLRQKINFDVEFVIANDASTDNTNATIEASIASNTNKNIHFSYYRQEYNLGMSSNFLFALQKCKGKYVALCEGDDYWTDPLKLEKQVDFLDVQRDYSFCWTRFNTFNQIDENLILDFNSRYFEKNQTYIDFDFETSSKGWHMGMQTLLFRKSALNISACKHFLYFRDAHLITQLLKINKGACLNFVSAVYRIHDGGVHSGVSTFERLEIAYHVNKEIYIDHKANKFLKKKYIQSYKNYLNANINFGSIVKSIGISIDLLFESGEFLNFLRNIKRILIKIK